MINLYQLCMYGINTGSCILKPFLWMLFGKPLIKGCLYYTVAKFRVYAILYNFCDFHYLTRV